MWDTLNNSIQWKSDEQNEYERNLYIRQEEHLKRVAFNRNWKPCLHDSCQTCHGTGISVFGGVCVHGISCDCPKCAVTC